MSSFKNRKDFAEEFVNYLVEKISTNKIVNAAFKRADNPATEYQCWEYLASWNINLENKNERIIFTTVAASIAKEKYRVNGNIEIGKALAACFDDGANNSQARSKLRRLLACDSTVEICQILRHLLSFIGSKEKVKLDYSGLLSDLLQFNRGDYSRQKIKTKWASSFYGTLKMLEEK